MGYPQSGEIIRSRRDIQESRSEYPAAERAFTVRAISGAGDIRATEYMLNYDGKKTHTR